MTFKELHVGLEYICSQKITRIEVEKFAELSGDFNPIHLDAEFAGNTIFGKPIIHGMIIGAMFSKVIASDFPGPGSIYLHQSMDFKKPIYHDTLVQLHLSISEIKKEKQIVILSTECYVDDVVAVSGSAVVKCMI